MGCQLCAMEQLAVPLRLSVAHRCRTQETSGGEGLLTQQERTAHVRIITPPRQPLPSDVGHVQRVTVKGPRKKKGDSSSLPHHQHNNDPPPFAAAMRPLTEAETQTVLKKLANYAGPALKDLFAAPAGAGSAAAAADRHVLRLSRSRVYYVRLALANLATSFARDKLLSCGTCLGASWRCRPPPPPPGRP